MLFPLLFILSVSRVTAVSSSRWYTQLKLKRSRRGSLFKAFWLQNAVGICPRTSYLNCTPIQQTDQWSPNNSIMTDCLGIRVSAFLGCWQINQTKRVQGNLPFMWQSGMVKFENVEEYSFPFNSCVQLLSLDGPRSLIP